MSEHDVVEQAINEHILGGNTSYEAPAVVAEFDLPNLDDKTIDRLTLAKFDREEAAQHVKIAARKKRIRDAAENVARTIRDELIEILQNGPLDAKLFKRVELVVQSASALILAVTDASDMAKYVLPAVSNTIMGLNPEVNYTADSELSADSDDLVLGLPNGPEGPLQPSTATENFGTGAMRELIAMAPKLLAGQTRPKLDELMAALEIAKKTERIDLVEKIEKQINKLLEVAP